MADGGLNPNAAMESDTKFDIDKAIREWKRDALRAGISASELEELDDHIHVTVARAIELGADPELSFSSALVSLGGVGHLGREYRRGKGRWLRALRWVLVLPAAVASTAFAQAVGMWVGRRLATFAWEESSAHTLSKVLASFPMGFTFVMVAILVAPMWWRAGVAWTSLAVICVWAALLLSAGSWWVGWMGVLGVLGALVALWVHNVAKGSRTTPQSSAVLTG